MSNNIIITGLPRSGKSTLVEKIISNIPRKKGFLTREIRQEGERVGFEIITYSNQKQILSHKNFNYPFKVSKYSVDVFGLERILPRFFKFEKDELLYIDEIGQMELFSQNFKNLVNKYLSAPNPFLATLSKVYSDDFTKAIKQRKDIILIEVTETNREQKYEEVKRLVERYFSQKHL